MADEKTGNAATRAKNKWQAANCDRINIVVQKGKKDTIKTASEAVGESLNAYIINAVDERMRLETEGIPGDGE